MMDAGNAIVGVEIDDLRFVGFIVDSEMRSLICMWKGGWLSLTD